MTKGKIALLAGACTMAATVIIVPTAVALSSRSHKVTPIITETSSVVVGVQDANTVESVISFNWNSKETPEPGTFKCTGYTMIGSTKSEITMSQHQIQPYRHWLGIYITFDVTDSPLSVYNLNLDFSFDMNGKEHSIGFNDIVLYVL